jgi:hypothetical protein
MKNIETLINQMKLNAKGRFVSVKGYTNSDGEISDYIIRVGISLNTLKRADRLTLQSNSFTDNTEKEMARLTLLTAVSHDPNQTKVTKLTEHKKYLCKGVYENTEKKEIYITGYIVSKKVIQKTNKKESIKKPETILKDEIKEELNLKLEKYRQFNLSKVQSIVINKCVIV